jgi:hypothetical protein
MSDYFFSGAGAGAGAGAGSAFAGSGAGAAGFASSFGAGFGGSAGGPQLISVKLVKKAIARNNTTSFFIYFTSFRYRIIYNTSVAKK